MIPVLAGVLYMSGWYLRVERFGSITAIAGFGCVPGVVCFSELNSEILPENPYVFQEGGYDGQFYYYAAASMFADYEAHYDDRVLRISRIGYPLLSGWVYPLFGASALILWMSILPFAFHIAAASLLAWRKDAGLMGAAIFAFNPFSYLSFLLDVSDGLALSLAVIGMLLLAPDSDTPLRRRKLYSGGLLMAMALLTKETFLAVPLGMMLGELIGVFWNSRAGFAGRVRRAIPSLSFWFMVTLPLFSWWVWIGYDVVGTASHASYPFSVLIRSVADGGFFDPMRASLAAVFVISAIYFLKIIFSENIRGDKINSSLVIMGILSCTMIALADAGEYWGNFANIARLFTPLVVPWILLRMHDRMRAAYEGGLLMLFVFILLKQIGEDV